MPPLENLLAVLFAGVLLSITPGPSMLYVLSRSAGQSRAAGFASVIGLALGGVILAVATALGLARVFAEFPIIIVVLRYLGLVYLVTLGVNMIWKARSEAQVKFEVAEVKHKSFMSIVWQGVLVELLNPKTVLFFALFLPPFVEIADGAPGDINVQSQLLILGILVPLTAIPSDAVIAYMGGTLTQSINNRQKMRERLAWAGGLTLIAIAINLHVGLL
jgi:threonine/homoserine/homoserine lactone efflux protein